MSGKSALELLDELILEIEESIKSSHVNAGVSPPPPTMTQPPKKSVPDLSPPIPETAQPPPVDATNNTEALDVSIDALDLRVGLITQVEIP